MNDPLQCTYEDARRNHLRDGMRMSTREKVEFFEEMVALVEQFEVRDRFGLPDEDVCAGASFTDSTNSER